MGGTFHAFKLREINVAKEREQKKREDLKFETLAEFLARGGAIKRFYLEPYFETYRPMRVKGKVYG